MPETWTGEVVGEMHCKSITFTEVAAEMGISREYFSAIVNSRVSPPNAEQRVRTALSKVVEKHAKGKAEPAA